MQEKPSEQKQSRRISHNSQGLYSLDQLNDSISKVFIQKQNILAFHSQSIPMEKGIARGLYDIMMQNQATLVILCAFHKQDINVINQELTRITIRRKINKTNYLKTEPIIRDLRDCLKQVRRKLYAKGGLFSISTQVLLMDITCQQFIPAKLHKFIIKLRNKITDVHDSEVWISTLMKINQPNGAMVVLCNKPHYYSNKESLQLLYRYFFCKKVAIWPFGRVQVNQYLKSNVNGVQERQHILTLLNQEKQIEKNFLDILKKLEFFYNNKFANGDTKLNALSYIIGTQQFENNSFSLRDKYLKDMLYTKKFLKLFYNLECNSFYLTMMRHIKDLQETSIFKSTMNDYLQNIRKLVLRMLIKVQLVDVESRRKINVRNLLYQSRQISKCFKQQERQFELLNYAQVNYVEQNKEEKGQDQFSNFSDELQQMKSQYSVISQKSMGLDVPESSNTMLMRSMPVRPFLQNQNQLNQEDQIQLSYRLQIREDFMNKKMLQLEKILDRISCSYRQFCQKFTEKVQNIVQGMQELKFEKYQHVIIFAPNSSNLIHRFVFEKINPASKYFNHLMKLMVFLHKEKQNRQCNIEFQANKLLKSKNKSKINQEFETTILEQELSQQLWHFYHIMNKYSHKQDNKQWNINSANICKQELRAMNFRYIDVERVQIPIDFNQDEEIVYGDNLKVQIVSNSNAKQIIRLIQIHQPDHCIFYSYDDFPLRKVYFAEKPRLKTVSVIYFKDSLQHQSVAKMISREDQAFWNIAQHRSKLPETHENAISRISQLKLNDKIDRMGQRIHLSQQHQNKLADKNSVFKLRNIKRYIIVDKRQMKSSLPSYLFHYGFQILPVFLLTADYIISDEIGVEKKSVETKDLQQSINSGRLKSQLERLQKTFKRPYLLIQFQNQGNFHSFNLKFKKERKNNRTAPNYYESNYQIVMKEVMALCSRFPKVKVIWSTSVKKTCEYFRLLKMNQPEPDVNKFVTKNQSKKDQYSVLSELQKEQRVQPKKPKVGLKNQSKLNSFGFEK